MDLASADLPTLQRWSRDPANGHVRPLLERRIRELEAAPSPPQSEAENRPTPATKRRGVANRTELRYAAEVLQPLLAAGEITRYEFEPITFHVHDVARYTVDWLAWLPDGGLWCIEVKGGQVWEKDRIRFKAHSKARPWLRWTMVQRGKRGAWITLLDRRPTAERTDA